MTREHVMSDQHPGDDPDRFVVRVTAESHFSWLRTRLSVERTMMAYTRTAVALIGFGFTIVTFFDRINYMPEVNSARYPDAAWYLGLALIFSGVTALVISVWIYFWMLRYLWSGGFAVIAGMTKDGTRTPVVATTCVLILTGIFAFFAVLLRWV